MNNSIMIVAIGLGYLIIALAVFISTVVSVVQGGVPLGGMAFFIINWLGYLRAIGRL